jgi:hypothetical protein
MPVRRIPWSRPLAAIAAGSLASCALLVGEPDGHRDLSGLSDPDSGSSQGETSVAADEGGPGSDGTTDTGDTGPTSGEGGLDAKPEADVVPLPREGGFTGSPLTLASGQVSPAGIAVSSDNLYWSSAGDGTVRRLARGDGGILGGTPVIVFSAGEAGAGGASDLLIDGTTLYALVGPGAAAASSCRTYVEMEIPAGTNWACAKPTNVCSSTSVASRIALDQSGTNVYMSNGTCDRIMYAPKPGNDSNAWTPYRQLNGNPIALAADGMNVYYAFDHEVDEQVVNSPNTAPTSFALSHTPIVDLVADNLTVYWVNSGGDVEALAKSLAGAPPTILATGQSHPQHMTLDDSNVYWTNQGAVGGQGSVAMASKLGGTPITLASNQSSPSAIAVDNTGVYWTNLGDGTIKMIPR